MVYTGPIDQFFNYRFGELNWRTLDLDINIAETRDFQGTAVMNFADAEIPQTRIHEFRHLHPERNYQSAGTVLMYEYSRPCRNVDEPFYPVNAIDDRAKLTKYREAASKESNVIFGGRLGSYQYLDMHMAIASALSKFESEIIQRLSVSGVA